MRLRDLGIAVGNLPTGAFNAITDVPGIQVGQASWSIDRPTIQRTGVTVIFPSEDPYRHPLYAATDVLNGFGELTGRAAIDEWGLLSSPIVLTNTRSVGQGYNAIFEHFYSIVREDEASLPLPVVGECDDSFLNDSRFATPLSTFKSAFGAVGAKEVEEGGVGAGTGMHLFGYKGGIGTSSRMVEIDGRHFTVGVLLNTNFGRPHQMRPIAGLEIEGQSREVDQEGSCIGVVATDAPLWPHELKRMARRIGLGLSRTGSVGNDGSGEIFLAFSTLDPKAVPSVAGRDGPFTGRGDGAPMSHLFDAVVEASEEAVWNALLAAKTTQGVQGHSVEGFLEGKGREGSET